MVQANDTVTGCSATANHANEDRFSISLAGDKATQEDGPTGVLAGKFGEPPRLLFKRPEKSINPSWKVSASWLAEMGPFGFQLHSWDLSQNIFPQQSNPGPSDIGGNTWHELFLLGDTVLFEEPGILQAGVWSWTSAKKRQRLLRQEGVLFSNFATDGKDMVWTRLEGPVTDGLDGLFKKHEVWTAPYSLDEEVVAKTARRLRVDRGTTSVPPWAVGCGYAARTFSNNEDKNALSIVRLSDGVSWLLPGVLPADDLSWERAMGFTCEELFVQVEVHIKSTIARIRLDSLGPGIPPD